MDWLNKWFLKLYETFIKSECYKAVISGLEKTVVITVVALAIGVVIGTVVAMIKVFADGNKKLKALNSLCDIYVTVIRGTPVTVQLLISFFIIFKSTSDGTWVAALTFGINSGAYVAETIRSGIMAIDKGQMEAGRSLGLSHLQTMKEIILPQAFKNVLPAIGNEMIALLKETSVASFLGVTEITKAGTDIINSTFDGINPLLLTALIYLVIVMLLTWLLKKMERRLRKSER